MLLQLVLREARLSTADVQTEMLPLTSDLPVEERGCGLKDSF